MESWKRIRSLFLEEIRNYKHRRVISSMLTEESYLIKEGQCPPVSTFDSIPGLNWQLFTSASVALLSLWKVVAFIFLQNLAWLSHQVLLGADIYHWTLFWKGTKHEILPAEQPKAEETYSLFRLFHLCEFSEKVIHFRAFQLYYRDFMCFLEFTKEGKFR